MSDTEPVVVAERSASGAFIAAVIVAVVVGVGALIWCYGLQNHISATDQKLAAADKKNADLADQLEATRARLSATTETLSQNVGRDPEADRRTHRDASWPRRKRRTPRRPSSPSSSRPPRSRSARCPTDVASVKTDVGGVKTDVATTSSDLETTKSQLQRVVGDAGVMSGLIATNHDELEELKHKGDRNYFEFTLQKGAKPTLLSTIKLQLKKVDDKHSQATP